MILVSDELYNPNRKEVTSMLFAPKEKGQGLVEYALILVLVAVVVIVILALLGPAIGDIFSNIVKLSLSKKHRIPVLLVNTIIHNQYRLEREMTTMLFAPKEKGQGLVEYALILVLVAVVVIVILALLGPAIGDIFSNIVKLSNSRQRISHLKALRQKQGLCYISIFAVIQQFFIFWHINCTIDYTKLQSHDFV
jgi:pilus assembly protein Flp/PilA